MEVLVLKLIRHILIDYDVVCFSYIASVVPDPSMDIQCTMFDTIQGVSN